MTVSKLYPLPTLVECNRLRDVNAELVKALDDIAKGMIPKLPPSDDKHEFRYAMWTWSQERARAALATKAEPEKG